jgi:GWxTD domain-containing protein
MKAFRPSYVRTAMLGLALMATVAGAAAPPDWKTPGKDWGKGPVHWLMSEEEEKQFKALKTDEERAAFAKSFWEKRDPTPGTPDNEYEFIFWQRVEQADKAYKTMLKEGSVSDFGRVFILLGPPSNIRKDSRYTYWLYEPSPVNGITQKMELSFAPIDTGYLLRDKKALEEYVAAHAESRGVGWKIPSLVPDASQEVAQAVPKEVVEDTSPESQRQVPILDAVIAKGSGPTDVAFQVTNDYYATADGTTLVVTTVEVPREAAHGGGTDALLAFARIAPEGDGKPVNLTGALPFVPAPVSDGPASGFVYQARRNLKPGTYKQVVVVEDKVMKGQMGTHVATIKIPDYSAKQFDMSSVSLLAQYGKKEQSVGPDDAAAGGAGLYSIGSFRLVPRAAPVLTKADTLAFYYQVYNPAPDASTGKPNLESTYAFFIKDASGWKPFRKPVVKPVGQVELWELPVTGLLGASLAVPVDFRMEAKVTDKTSGQSLTREIQFSVR